MPARSRSPHSASQNDVVNVEAAETFFALLAIVALVGAVMLAVARVVPAGRTLSSHLYEPALWLAFLVAATSMGGSLYFSEHIGFEPCKMCWLQRIAMFSLVVVLLVGAIRRDRGVRYYAVPLAGIGLAISIYHRLIEWHPEWEGGGVCSLTVPCSSPYFKVWDVITLSTMAACGFLAILALLLLVPKPIAAAGPASARPAIDAPAPSDEQARRTPV